MSVPQGYNYEPYLVIQSVEINNIIQLVAKYVSATNVQLFSAIYKIHLVCFLRNMLSFRGQ